MTTRRKFLQSAFIASASSLVIPTKLYSRVLLGENYTIDLGVCTIIDNSELVLRNGFGFLEETVGKFLVPKESDEAFSKNLEKLHKSKLKLHTVNGFLPGDMKSVGPDVNIDQILKWGETTFKRMQQSDMQILVFGSGGSRRIPDGFDANKAKLQFIELNRKLAPIAEKYNVTIVLEPLNYGETNILNTVEEGIWFTNEVNHPQIRLLADIYHMLKNGEKADSILKADKLLKHTHIAEKEKRAAPGVAGDDFRSYFSALKRIGYKGKLTIECIWTDMEKELPIALQTLQKQWEEVS